jgi:hypothetical protein
MNLKQALDTFRKMRSTVSGYGPIVGSESNLAEYDEALDALVANLEAAHTFHLNDGTTMIVRVGERGATGSEHLSIIHDSVRTGKFMAVLPQSSNAVNIISIIKP